MNDAANSLNTSTTTTETLTDEHVRLWGELLRQLRAADVSQFQGYGVSISFKEPPVDGAAEAPLTFGAFKSSR